MIEERIKTYLDTALQGTPIYLEVPKTMPGKFIVFQIADGGRTNRIDAVTLEFNSYADSKYDAAVLDESLREAMDSINDGTDITCKINTRSDSQDSTLKKYRYRCYYNLYY